MKILVADDDHVTRYLLETLLEHWDHQVVLAENGQEAWDILSAPDPPQLAVLDWMMPGIEGDEICRRVRAEEEAKGTHTYLILLTAKDSTHHIVTGLEAGADDFIVKPVDREELRMRVRAGQRIVQLQSDFREIQQALQVQASTDSLTGVLNRRAILSQLKTEMSRARRGNNNLSLSLLDVDHFKEINDEQGHLAGDAVLKECVTRISQVTRPYDSLGRVGGEEFLILFPETDQSEAFALCDRLREVIAGDEFEFNGTAMRVTISQGVVTSDGEGTVDDLIGLADRGLYRAKGLGRNRVARIEGREIKE